MNLIAAVDKNWGIGYENKLLVSIPDDMKFFREVTTGNVVVMGRKTLESFPGGSPLKNRTNIVLSRNPGFAPKGVIVVHNPEELKEELKKYDSSDIYVVRSGMRSHYCGPAGRCGSPPQPFHHRSFRSPGCLFLFPFLVPGGKGPPEPSQHALHRIK